MQEMVFICSFQCSSEFVYLVFQIFKSSLGDRMPSSTLCFVTVVNNGVSANHGMLIFDPFRACFKVVLHLHKSLRKMTYGIEHSEESNHRDREIQFCNCSILAIERHSINETADIYSRILMSN